MDEQEKKEKSSLRKFLIASVVTSGYLWMTFMIGVFIIFLYNLIIPTDFTSVDGLWAAVAIFSIYFIFDVGLLSFNKITPAIIAIVIVASPFIAVAKLFKDTEIVEIDNRVSSRVSNYVFLKKVFNNTC